MKANELMIGDLVLAVDTIGAERCIARILELKDVPYLACGIWGEIHKYELLEPIPLTPVILEENGFSYPKQSAWMKLDCPERELWGCLHTDGTFWLYSSGDCDKDESFAEIRYVHELQHALKLCGIEKEITI